jgi:hypothetical protein
LQKYGDILTRTNGGAADLADHPNERIRFVSRLRLATIDLTNFLDEIDVFGGHINHISAMSRQDNPPLDPFKQPGAQRVEFTNLSHIEPDNLSAIQLRRDGVGKRLKRGPISRCPGPTGAQVKMVARYCRR